MQYKIPFLTYYAMKHMVRVQYMTLPNLITAPSIHPANKEKYNRHSPDHAHVLFPEYPDWRDRSHDVAQHAIEWLKNEPARQALINKLTALRNKVAIGGASANAADYILKNVLYHRTPAARAA
jgi:lipid A disaccharide synthetase